MKLEELNLTACPSPAYAMCYYMTGVEFGVYKGGNDGWAFSWPENAHKQDEILELHIFDWENEYRAYISEGSTKEIKISDSAGEQYLDEYMLFFGENFINTFNGGVALSDRGQIKNFYFPVSKKAFDEGLSLGVRNYIKFDENDMVHVTGYRLRGLFTGKGSGRIALACY